MMSFWGMQGRIERAVTSISIVCVLFLAGQAPADTCVENSWDNGTATIRVVFPNWEKAWVGSYDVLMCNGCAASPENIKGVTIVNFGTAPTADIKGVYWQVECGALDSGYITMTYAGIYGGDSGAYPAWTWAGSSPDLSGCPTLCPLCAGYFTINVYVDIASCPTDQATVALGFPTNATLNPTWWGSITDSEGCAVPWYDMYSTQRISYVVKEADRETVAPGETITYTIRYGRPGIGTLNDIWITDSLPPYTHYVAGSASPAPDLGWDPAVGPPLALRWNFSGSFPTAGGPTGEPSPAAGCPIRFSM